MKEFFRGFLSGSLVWTFGAIFFAFILCFLCKDMPNEVVAGWVVAVAGSACAAALQGWYSQEFEKKYNWFHVGLATVIFIFAGLIRTLAEF